MLAKGKRLKKLKKKDNEIYPRRIFSKGNLSRKGIRRHINHRKGEPRSRN